MGKKLFLKRKYLEMILSGEKTLEGRVGYRNIKLIKKGDEIYINGIYKVIIEDKWEYNSFKEALKHHPYKELIPDAKDEEDVVNAYRLLYPEWKEKKYGVVIFKIKPL